LDFSALKAELVARGFDSLTTTRQGYYINSARAELDRMFFWPWRESFSTGLAPLAVSDLARVEKVINTSQSSLPLAPVDYSSLVDCYGDLSLAGTPTYYYLARPDRRPVLEGHRRPDSAGSDTPASPSEAHYTIVDLAVRRAYRDNDEHDNAAALQPEIDNAISQLLDQYPPGIPDGPLAYTGVTGASEDW
jgi:hypothetical protein